VELLVDFSPDAELDPFFSPDAELDPFLSPDAELDAESLVDEPLAELFAFWPASRLSVR
jgi:hypothetical protein